MKSVFSAMARSAISGPARSVASKLNRPRSPRRSTTSLLGVEGARERVRCLEDVVEGRDARTGASRRRPSRWPP